MHFFDYKAKQVFDYFREEVDFGKTALEKLKNLIRRHLDEFQKDRNMAVLYQAETHKYYRISDARIREISKHYKDILTEVVELGQEEGTIRKDLYLGLVKRIIIGSVNEVICTWLHSETQYNLTTMADPLVDLIIGGIGTKNPANLYADRRGKAEASAPLSNNS